MHRGAFVRFRAALLSAAIAGGLTVGLAVAQMYPPLGPGQDVPAPAIQCPQVLRCSYSEADYSVASLMEPGIGYRFQSLLTCGASCVEQYWVRDAGDGRVLLTIGPGRIGATIAIRQVPGEREPYPPIRVVMADYQPTDAMCCPAQFKDTTYVWDAARGALVADTPTIIPIASYSREQVQRQLEAAHFVDVFR